MAETAAIAAATQNAGSYRVKFDRTDFLELVQIANPRIIYRRRNMYFFAFDGFVMYCDQCSERDFGMRILDAIEFSNVDWTK